MGTSFPKIILFVLLVIALALPATAQVFVNEVTANSANDYVEVYYNGTGTVSLTNFRINSSTTLGNALTGTLSSTSRYATFTEAQLGYNFVNADTLTLVNTTSGSPVNTFTYTGLTPSNSAGRIPDGTGAVAVINKPTPAAKNNNNPTFSITVPLAFNEDNNGTINLGSYASDPETANVNLTYSASPANNLTININQNTKIATIIPDADWFGTRSVIFFCIDTDGGIASSTLSVTVNAVNDAPKLNFSSMSNSTLTTAEDNVATFNIGTYASDAEDAVANLTFGTSGATTGLTVTINQTTDIVTITPNANWFGTTAVTFTATDTNAAVGNSVLTVNVTSVNDLPVLNFSAINPININEDGSTTIPLQSYTADVEDAASALTYSAANVNNVNVSINPTTNVATITPDADWNGQRTLTFTALDTSNGAGVGTVTLNVSAVNDAPRWNFSAINSTYTFSENTNGTLDLTPYVSDPEDPLANLTLNSTPVANIAVTINPTTHVATFVPDTNWIGQRTITFTAMDTQNVTGTGPLTVVVNASALNKLPVINFSQSPLNGSFSFDEDVNATLDLAPYVSDNETALQNLIFNITQVANMQINLTSHTATQAIVTFYPDANWHGQRNVTFTVIDGNGGSASAVLPVTVNSINDLVVFNGTIPTQFFFSGQSKVIDLSTHFSDEDNMTSMVFDTPQKDGNLTVAFNSAARTATITAAAGYSGISSMTINATDNVNSTIASNSFFVQVLPYNNAPVITPAIPNIVMNEDSYHDTMDLDNYVNDSDTQKSAMTWYTSPNANIFVSINPTTHMANITTKKDYAGNETITFTVSDGTSTASQNVSIEVLNTDNDPPVIPTLTSPADAAVISDQSMQVTLQWTSYDPDNTPLTYSVYFGTDQNPPHYVDTTSNNLTVNLTDDTTYYWYVTASDGVHTTNKSATYMFRTDAPNFAPEITAFTPAGTAVTVNEGENLTFTPTVIDRDNDPLAYQWTLDNVVVSTDSTYTYSPGFTDSGTKTLSFKVTDQNSGQYASRTFTITVNDVQPQFSLASASPSSNNILIRQGASQAFSITLNNPTHQPTTYKWFVNGNEEAQSQTFTLNTANRGAGPFTVSVEARNDQAGLVTYSWTVQTATRPTSRSGRIRGTILSIPDDQLHYATNVTIEVPNVAKIDFGAAVIDLTNVIDLDSFMVLDSNIAGIDSQQFSALNIPATITLYGIPYDEAPIINYTTAFTREQSQITSAFSGYTLVSYSEAPTAFGTVVFTVPGFSTYTVGNTVDTGARLEIDNLEINGDRIRVDPEGRDRVDDIKPGDRVTIEMEVKNTFPRRNGLEIEGIEVEVTIYDIDDGDDLNFDSDRDFDLDPDDEEDVSLDFRVPYEVEDGERYEILIEVEGIDEHGFKHKASARAYLEIEKDKHNIKITELNLRPSSVSCTRVANVELEVTNLGEDDEDNAKVTITNEQLGISESYTFDLDGDPYDEDFDITKNFILNIPADAEPGVYDLDVNTYYDLVRPSDSRFVQLTVQDCEDTSYQTYNKPPVAQPSPIEVQIIDSGKQPMVTTDTQVEGNSTKYVLLMLIIIGALLVIIMLVYMFMGNSPEARAKREKRKAWKKYQDDMKRHAELERRRRVEELQRQREQTYNEFRRKQWEEFRKRQQQGGNFGGR